MNRRANSEGKVTFIIKENQSSKEKKYYFGEVKDNGYKINGLYLTKSILDSTFDSINGIEI